VHTRLTIQRREAGLTLLELLLVISMLVVLASILYPSYNYFKRKAEDAVCMANMRSLHAGLSTYLHDHSFIWPQDPSVKEGAPSTTESNQAQWWYEQLKDYGPTRETWLCPSERRGFAIDNDKEHFESTYIPTYFEGEPNQAYKWTRQPWVIERGGFHDQGQANLIYPDGHMEKHDGMGGGF
jgi:prepilin-type N-terminal cleavage/methylation domain-containing protein